MKKVLLSMLAIGIAAFTFTSCDDVPMPYDMPGTTNGGGNEELPAGTYLSAPFSNSDGNFITKETKDGSQPWVLDSHGYMKGTGHISNDVPKVESESYLISPEFDLTNSTGAYLEFEYILRYVAAGTSNKVLITDNYTEDPATTQWTDITGTLTEGTDWNNWSTYSQNIPAAFLGKDKVRVAFFFGCNTQNASTWEVRNVVVKEGQAGEGGGGGTTPSAGTGTGTESDPYDVPAAISVASKTGVFVKGYIVGYVGGQALDETATFSAEGEVSQTNVLIAASPNETTVANCMPVQLPSGAVRTGVNLKDNPGNLKQEVLLYGDIDTYFRVPGLKNTSYAKIGTKESGNKPGTTPAGEAKGTGTAADPFNPVAAYNEAAKLAADAVSSQDYYVKGKISSITYSFDAEHGTATFKISEDGTASSEFIVYGCKYFNKASWKDGDEQIKVGDEVVICGKFTNYKGNTPEFKSGENWLVSLNGESGGTTPPPSTDAGSYASPLTVSAAIALGSADQAWVRGFIVGFVDGRVYADGCNFSAPATVNTNILIATTANETDPAKCMPVQLPNGDLRTKLNLQDNASLLGQSVLLYGQLTAYFSVPGIKAPTYAEVGNQQIGTRPSARRR